MTRRTALKTRLARPLLAGAVATGAALTLSGCFYLSPDEVTSYNASDGIAASVGKVQLSNILVATSAKGAAGTVYGTATNPTQEPVELTVTPTGGSATTVTVPAATAVRLDGQASGNSTATVPAATAVRLDGQASGNSTATAGPVKIAAVGAEPGANTQITFATQSAGSVPVSVPVVLDSAPYGSASVSHATYDAPTSSAGE